MHFGRTQVSKASLLQISHKPDGIMRKSCMQKWCRGEFDNSNLVFWGDGVIASHAGLTPSQNWPLSVLALVSPLRNA